MIIKKLIAAAVAAFWLAAASFAQSATPEGIVDKFAQAWNSHDMGAFEKIFTADAHFMPMYDTVHEGRANIVADFKKAHESWARTTSIPTSKVSVQHLGRKITVVYFNVIVTGPGVPTSPELVGRSLLLVVVKEKEGWRIASGQLTKPNCPK